MTGCAMALAGKLAPAFGAPVREIRRGGMVYRRLGQTDLYPSLLAFGAHTDSAYKVPVAPGSSVLNPEGQARRDHQVAHALDLGVNLVDAYMTEGQWEPLERLVRPRRDKVLVSLYHNAPEFVARNIERGARLFGHVDLYRFPVRDGTVIDGKTLEDWDALRKAKEAGTVRAIGISTHMETEMVKALAQLEGLDYIFFPYNFIHARADYSEFLPKAIAKGVGLIAMKPLAMGSIVSFDPRARPDVKPENQRTSLFTSQNRMILPAAVAQLTSSLSRLPDETLCQAAMRFVYSKDFLSSVVTGMWDDQWVDDNYKAIGRYSELRHEERAALDAAARVAKLVGPSWLPPDYQWLEDEWGVPA
jgi:aryl-alcohol dehydrogenase-like predicted oxidoreductase